MPVCLYLRGVPGSGKYTVSRILERDLGWPRLWVHHFDAVYRAIGDYKVPWMTDRLMAVVAIELMNRGKDFICVRPARQAVALSYIVQETNRFGHDFIPVRLTASYETLVTRVERRRCGNESPFRLTSKEALDEYLDARPEQPFDGETVIDTDSLTPEQVADRIKVLVGRPELRGE